MLIHRLKIVVRNGNPRLDCRIVRNEGGESKVEFWRFEFDRLYEVDEKEFWKEFLEAVRWVKIRLEKVQFSSVKRNFLPDIKKAASPSKHQQTRDQNSVVVQLCQN